MKQHTNPLHILIVLLCVTFSGSQGFAQNQASEAELLSQLADPERADWERVEQKVIDVWSRSGSSAMDLLLQRGRDALDQEDYKSALEHFTALTDHAPQFAEGWNMRATAFFLIDELGLAVEDISRTLALNPNHFGALNGLGVVLEQLGDDENALLAYRAAYEINPHRENLVEAIDRLKDRVDGSPV